MEQEIRGCTDTLKRCLSPNRNWYIWCKDRIYHKNVNTMSSLNRFPLSTATFILSPVKCILNTGVEKSLRTPRTEMFKLDHSQLHTFHCCQTVPVLQSHPKVFAHSPNNLFYGDSRDPIEMLLPS